MSIFWERKTYKAFKYQIGRKFTLREKLCFKWYPTPGCNMHDHMRSKRVFERRVGLKSNKANLVYWRMHPKEWDQVRGEHGRKHI